MIKDARPLFRTMYGNAGFSLLNSLRAHLFASSKEDLHSFPPTENAFHFEALRSLRKIILHKQTHLRNPSLLAPEEYGSVIVDDRAIPIMTTKPSKLPNTKPASVIRPQSVLVHSHQFHVLCFVLVAMIRRCVGDQ